MNEPIPVTLAIRAVEREVKPATDEYVAAYKADIAREGECSCPRYGECASHCCESVLSLIARIEADRADIARLKADSAPLREAIGMLATLHPTMVMDPPNPMGMAQEIHAHVTTEQARLKAEVERLSECGHCGGPVDGSCCKFNEGRAR